MEPNPNPNPASKDDSINSLDLLVMSYASETAFVFSLKANKTLILVGLAHVYLDTGPTCM
jgi:hypothetical protein